jgi:CheY-like chemotaxis protein
MYPTLILGDLYLPRLSGHKFLVEIRRPPEFENVPVALWTGLCSPQAIEAAYEYGAQMCLMELHSLQGWVQLAESLAGIMAQPSCEMSTPGRNRTASRLSSPGGYLRHCLEVCSQTTE